MEGFLMTVPLAAKSLPMWILKSNKLLFLESFLLSRLAWS